MPRKQHKYHYLYKTTCIITGKFYYGMHSTSNLEDGYLGSGKVLRRSIYKHGKDKHSLEILEFFDNRKDLIQGEIDLITEELLENPLCMNLMRGGMGGLISEEQQRSRSIAAGKALAAKLQNDLEFKLYHSKISSESSKLHHANGLMNTTSWNWKGKSHKNETKKKIGEANSKMIGAKNSQYGTIWIHNLELKENKKIKIEDLTKYPAWIRGRKMKF